MVTYGEILSNRYLVQDELGSGGMSVVYRAMDLHTGGIVAIKIPHPFLLRSPQFLQRLKREAEIAVNLHSSRIARVTDVSEHAGAPYLVLEYVPGKSLSDLIATRGPLPPVEALTIVLDVARAMQTAHEHGVVHRDIKPQNIYITPSGDVKVLDFGIARMEGLSNITTASVFLGTPDYAAPERAEDVGDIRSDIYSLGVVLYEALAGARPFNGSTPWKTMELHLTAPPPSLPDTVPEQVRVIVERCLEKDPADRYQTPAELVVALRRVIRILDRHDDDDHLETSVAIAPPPELQASPESEPITPPTPEPAAPPAPEPAPKPVAPPVAAAEVRPRDGTTTGAETRPSPPAAGSEAEIKPTPARGLVQPPAPPPGITTPPQDGSSAWFRRPVVALAGIAALLLIGAVVALIALPDGDDSSTTNQTTTETSPTTTDGSSTGSSPTGNGGTTRGPALTIRQPADGASVGDSVTVEVAVDGATLKPASEGDPEARHLHYFLDVDPATVGEGKPIPIDQPAIVHTANTSHTFQGLQPGEHTVSVVLGSSDHLPLNPSVAGTVRFTVTDPLANARSGESAPIVYQGVEGKWRIFRMNGNGSDRRALTNGASDDTQPALSPDGTRIAFVSNRDGSNQIYTMTIDGTEVQRITNDSSNNHSPAWRPDGSEIVYTSNRDGRDHLWIVPAAGGEPRQLTSGQQTDGNPSWSPDGKTIAYHSNQSGGVQHIFTIDAGGGTPKQISNGTTPELMPAWSPDGKQIAFASYDGGQWDIYVMNADGSTRRRLTNTFFNQKPSWSPDAKHILFHSNQDNNVQQVFVIPSAGGTPRRLTEGTNINQNASWPLR